jgi:tetratricopeptide (TPR) repeat protein
MSKLSETRLIVLPQSPHYIQHYDPTTVIESIKRIVFPDAENRLRKTLRDMGVERCIAQYKKMKATYPNEFMRERVLNTLGYEILQNGNTKDAIALFALNVSMYPTSYNTYDSLAEAYMDAGNKKEAIKNYEKSLALNPANTNAVRMLKKLK